MINSLIMICKETLQFLYHKLLIFLYFYLFKYNKLKRKNYKDLNNIFYININKK